MRPALGGLHGFPEVHGEDGPIGAIGLEVRDVGRELFNGGGGRHFSEEVCSKVVFIDS